MRVNSMIAPQPKKTIANAPSDSARTRRGREGVILRSYRAMLCTPFVYLLFDSIPHAPRLLEFLFVRPCELRGIGEAPMQPLASTRKYGTAFGTRFVTNSN